MKVRFLITLGLMNSNFAMEQEQPNFGPNSPVRIAFQQALEQKDFAQLREIAHDIRQFSQRYREPLLVRNGNNSTIQETVKNCTFAQVEAIKSVRELIGWFYDGVVKEEEKAYRIAETSKDRQIQILMKFVGFILWCACIYPTFTDFSFITSGATLFLLGLCIAWGIDRIHITFRSLPANAKEYHRILEIIDYAEKSLAKIESEFDWKALKHGHMRLIQKLANVVDKDFLQFIRRI